MSSEMEEKPDKNEIRNILSIHWPFSYLSPSEREQLLDLSILSFKNQDIVYEVNDQLQNCYLILRGALCKRVPKNNNLRFQEFLTVGALFGEQFVLLEELSTEDISVDAFVMLLEIPMAMLLKLIKKIILFHWHLLETFEISVHCWFQCKISAMN